MIEGGACIDITGKYRYELDRMWNRDQPFYCWVMLNPSTADAGKDDPTIRRCIRYTFAWGGGGLVVVNLFGYRATFPKQLKLIPDPVGPDNDRSIERIVSRGTIHEVICAWGNDGAYQDRDQQVMEIIRRYREPKCLAISEKTRQPKHPLYQKAELKPILYLGR